MYYYAIALSGILSKNHYIADKNKQVKITKSQYLSFNLISRFANSSILFN